VSLAAWVAIAVTALGGLYAWFTGRAKRAAQVAADAWRARAEHNDRRADAAEDVIDQQLEQSTETQRDLEERARATAQDRIDHADPGARRRVQDRWAAAAEADRAAREVAALRARAATQPGTGPARGPALRGRK
jgi:hypothetical protein